MFIGAFIVTLFLLNILPKLQKYNPIGLASKNMSLLAGDIMAMAIVSIGIIILSIFTAIRVFNKKQI